MDWMVRGLRRMVLRCCHGALVATGGSVIAKCGNGRAKRKEHIQEKTASVRRPSLEMIHRVDLMMSPDKAMMDHCQMLVDEGLISYIHHPIVLWARDLAVLKDRAAIYSILLDREGQEIPDHWKRKLH